MLKPRYLGDVLINLSFNDDENHHICELQIVHSKLYTAREELSRHDSYEWWRSAKKTLDIMLEHLI